MRLTDDDEDSHVRMDEEKLKQPTLVEQSLLETGFA